MARSRLTGSRTTPDGCGSRGLIPAWRNPSTGRPQPTAAPSGTIKTPTWKSGWRRTPWLACFIRSPRFWDVPLMVTRGYASLSYLYSAGRSDRSRGQARVSLLLRRPRPERTGHHPVGGGTAFREFAPEADITFERVAVTPEQIEAMSLPTRPTKTTDSRARGLLADRWRWTPSRRPRCERWSITASLNTSTLMAHERLLAVEQAERETLTKIAEGGGRS